MSDTTHTTFSSAPDPLLLPFLRAADATSAQAQLDRLIHEHADPIIANAVRHHAPRDHASRTYCSPDTAADLRADAVAAILTRITSVRQTGNNPIRDFRSYVKVAARHVCWNQARTVPRDLLRLDSGANAMTDTPDTIRDISDPRADTPNLIQRRGFLQAVWSEIRLLPRDQRVALLFNFRDIEGGNALPLLVRCGITTVSEVATALGICPEELPALCEQPPLEDDAIAARMGVDRRKVINLRLAARRRLERRLRAWIQPDRDC